MGSHKPGPTRRLECCHFLRCYVVAFRSAAVNSEIFEMQLFLTDKTHNGSHLMLQSETPVVFIISDGVEV